MSDLAALKQSPLVAAHHASMAKMIEFSGWSMPIYYSGINDEHIAVRSNVGMFDISHMGEVSVSGPGALQWLERLLTNRVAKLDIARGQYTMMLNENGGIIDDLIIYRTGENDYFLVINAACRKYDLQWMRRHLPSDNSVLLKDLGDEYAAIALQGPNSEKIFRKLYPISKVPRRNSILPLISSHESIPSLCARTGYTGEDGFEFFFPCAEIELLWNRLLDLGVKPCGLGARDTLRLEMGYPLNGSDLSEDYNPLEANLGKFVSLDDPAKSDFLGRATLEKERFSPILRQLTALQLIVQGPPLRSGYSVIVPCGALCDTPTLLSDNQDNPNSHDIVVGKTCSGAFSPSLGKGIAMAYLDYPYYSLDTSLEIEIRDRRYRAKVVTLPFYKKESNNLTFTKK